MIYKNELGLTCMTAGTKTKTTVPGAAAGFLV